MAQLLALIERLDAEPSKTYPPPDEPGADEEPSSALPSSNDRTIVDPTRMFPEALLPQHDFDGFDMSLPHPTNPPPAHAIDDDSVDVDFSQAPPKMPSAPPSSHNELIGRVIASKYKIEGVIGSGSTAAVFRAVHIDLRRPFAIKILHAANRGEMQFVKRFKGEALAASKLEHVNVARVIDYGQEKDGLLYLVMELLTGKSLEAVLAASGGKIPQRKAVDIAIQACSALAFAHDEGIIHRDVKPENIMLVPKRDDDGNVFDLVKVCDFGMAKLREPDPEQGELTIAGMLCGSPAYMSPEQTRGETLDARTDVYSLGVTLFEALTGKLPHDGKSIPELFTNKIMETPERPSAIADVDPVIDDVVLRALDADPRQRPATARALREDLRAALAILDDETDDFGTIIAD
jgi:serine/threonine-protein kinase